MSAIELIKSDLYRYHGKLGLGVFIRAWLLNAGFNYSFWLRLAQSSSCIVAPIASLVLTLKIAWGGIQIPKATKVGPGLYIGHGGPCIVNPTARLGANVNISQFVTIGSNNGQAAFVGDNVYIGPNSIIIEDVVIGHNVTVGAASVVTRSVPDNCTVAGNPARVLNMNQPGRYVNRRWPIAGHSSAPLGEGVA